MKTVLRLEDIPLEAKKGDTILLARYIIEDKSGKWDLSAIQDWEVVTTPIPQEIASNEELELWYKLINNSTYVKFQYNPWGTAK